MISAHIKVILQRFLELLFTNIFISVFVAFLNLADIIKTDSGLCGGLIMGLALFMYINVRLMRQCYFEMKNRGTYYFVNIAAYLIFAGISLGGYYWFPEEIFGLFFAIFKFLKFSRLATGTFYSLVIGHSIGFLCVFLSPVGMNWVFSHALED